MSEATGNPYVGPRPFTQRERNLFFGRDREANDLIPLVISERLVLFYAQSGAGKSSLINARLIPGLVERNFIVLPVARVSGQVLNDEQVDNIFVYNLLHSLEKGEMDKAASQNLAQMSLQHFLSEMEFVETTEPAERLDDAAVPVDAPQVIDGVRPMALIIDQFEEIFTTHPEAWNQRGPFFEQLCDAMEADPYLWVVLTMREDYVAALDPYAYLLPGRLQARFYMQRMGYQAAMEAVTRPVENLRPFAPGVAEKLVKNLSQIVISRAGDVPVFAEGPNIEPVQLQVVCYQLWENLKNQPGSQITEEDLNLLTGGSDLAEFISRALGEFYEQAIASVMSDPSVTVTERQLRGWFSEELITEGGTRGAVRQGRERTGSLPNNVVRLLQEKFIIRSETRGGNAWFELSHDRFVSPILAANRAWNERNPRPIRNDAEAWEKSGRDPSKLYEGRQLTAAAKMLEAQPDEWSDLEQDFIRAGQGAADKQRTLRQRIIMGIGLAALLIMAFLMVNAIFNAQKAADQSATAVAAEADVRREFVRAETARADAVAQQAAAEATGEAAQVDRARAITAEANAREEGQKALAAEATARADRSAAIAARDQAEEQRVIAVAAQNNAQAGQLSSLSDYFRGNQLDLSQLLSVAAVKLSNSWETRRALLDGVQVGLDSDVRQVGNPRFDNADAISVAYSPAGELYAAGMNNGDVLIISVEGSAREFDVPAAFRSAGQINAVAFDSEGTLLARASNDAKVPLLDMNTRQIVRTIRPFGATYSTIVSLAFQPDGDLLAIGTEREGSTNKGMIFIYNYQTNQEYFTWDCGPYTCLTLAWSPDGRHLAIGNTLGDIQVIDIRSRREVTSIPRAHSDDITGLAWYQDGQRLVSGGLDQRIRQWQMPEGNKLRESARQSTPVITSMAISPDGRYLLVGRTNTFGAVGMPQPGSVDSLPYATVWNAETLELLPNLSQKLADSHDQNVQHIAFNSLGDRFLTAGRDNYIYQWQFLPIDPLSKPVAALRTGRADVAVDESGSLIYAQNTVGGQALVTAEDGTALPAVTIPNGRMIMERLDGKPVLMVGGFNGQVSFIDPTTGQPVREPVKYVNGTIHSLAVSGDGSVLAVTTCTSSPLCDTISIFDLSTGTKEQEMSGLVTGSVDALGFSADARLLAIGSSEGEIVLFDRETQTAEELVTEGLSLRDIKLAVTAVAFSPDEAGMLAAGLFGGRVALWDVRSRGPVGDFAERANGTITGMTFRKDAQGLWTMITTTDRGEGRIWEVDTQAWIARACKSANRDLTPEERNKFLKDNDTLDSICVQP